MGVQGQKGWTGHNTHQNSSLEVLLLYQSWDLQVMGRHNHYTSGDYSSNGFTLSVPLLPKCHQGSDVTTVLLNKCGAGDMISYFPDTLKEVSCWTTGSNAFWNLKSWHNFFSSKGRTLFWEMKMLKRNEHIAQPHLKAQGLLKLIWSE